MKRKIFSILLSACMVITMMPAMVWAEPVEEEGQQPEVVVQEEPQTEVDGQEDSWTEMDKDQEGEGDGQDDSEAGDVEKTVQILNYGQEFNLNGYEADPDSLRILKDVIETEYDAVNGKGPRIFEIVDPSRFNDATLQQEASDNILNYLREIYRTDEYEKHSDEQVTNAYFDEDEEVYKLKEKLDKTDGIDDDLKQFVPWYEVETYAVISKENEDGEMYLLGSFDEEENEIFLYWSDCPDIPDAEMEFGEEDGDDEDEDDGEEDVEEADEEADAKICTTEQLKTSIGNSNLKLTYMAKVTIRVPKDPDQALINYYDDIYEVPYDCNYCGYVKIADRPFNMTLSEETVPSDLIDLLDSTSSMREEGWGYNDLCRINVLVQQLLYGDEVVSNEHQAMNFFKGAFAGKYNTLIGGVDGLTIKAELPTGGRGNLMSGNQRYQGHYYIGDVLYFIDTINAGLLYDSFLLIDKNEINDETTVSQVAEKRINTYLDGTGITARVSSETDNCDFINLLVTSKGVYQLFNEDEEDEDGDDGNEEEIVANMEDNGDEISGEENDDEEGDEDQIAIGSDGNSYRKVDELPVSVVDYFSDKLFEDEMAASLNKDDDNNVITLTINDEEFNTYNAYIVSFEGVYDEPIEMPYIIAATDSGTIDSYDKLAYGSDSMTLDEGRFEEVRIKSNNGFIPFDLFMDAEETTVLDKWNGEYAAIDITPKSVLADAANKNGNEGYSMQVSATGVKLGDTTLKASDTFRVWDEEKQDYLKDDTGTVKVFTVNSDDEIVFNAKHFSTYAIVPAVEEEPEPKPVVQTPTLNFKSTTLPLKIKQKVNVANNVLMESFDGIQSVTYGNAKSKKYVTISGTTIKGKKKGTAVINVTLNSGLTKSFKVKVQKSKVTGKITLGCAKKITLNKGESLAINASKSPITCTYKLKYSSSKKKVASVSKNGVIKAKKKGKAKIYVKCGKKRKTIKVTVK